MMDVPITGSVSAALVAGGTLVAVEGLRYVFSRWKRTQRADGVVDVAKITDSAKLRGEMMEQIERLWSRSREQDEEIRRLHNDLNECEGRHTTLMAEHELLKGRYERFLLEFRRAFPERAGELGP